MLSDSRRNQLQLVLRTQAHNPQQQHTAHGLALAKYQLTEVLVRGNQHGLYSYRQSENFGILDPWSRFQDMEHVVTVSAKTIHHKALHAFVRYKPHCDATSTG